VIENNFTNITKAKESHLTSTYWTLNRPWRMVLEI